MRILYVIACSSLLTLTACKVKAEELYIRGLGEIFSAGVCSIGAGKCISSFFVDNAIADFCERRPKQIRVAGHSLGASAAIRFVNGMQACGLKVDAAAFLDPMVHPREYGIPAGIRTLTLYSTTYAGVGENQPDAEFYTGGHIMQAFDPSVLRRVRALFDRR